MALKDWKKSKRLVSNLSQRYMNYKKYLTLDIHPKDLWNPSFRVSVTLTKNMMLIPVVDKFFKTKNEADKFAKSYMRAH
jgi:hypothetical protein